MAAGWPLLMSVKEVVGEPEFRNRTTHEMQGPTGELYEEVTITVVFIGASFGVPNSGKKI